MVEENAEVIKPTLERMEISKKIFFYFEDPLKSTRDLVSFNMPYWNYLESHVDPDIMLEGLRKTELKDKLKKYIK